SRCIPALAHLTMRTEHASGQEPTDADGGRDPDRGLSGRDGRFDSPFAPALPDRKEAGGPVRGPVGPNHHQSRPLREATRSLTIGASGARLRMTRCECLYIPNPRALVLTP